jgi:hypothetical protein
MDVSILKHKTQNYWSVLIIDYDRPGTHTAYNVVYNSNCNKEKFNTFAEAANKARITLRKYNNNELRNGTNKGN